MLLWTLDCIHYSWMCHTYFFSCFGPFLIHREHSVFALCLSLEQRKLRKAKIIWLIVGCIKGLIQCVCLGGLSPGWTRERKTFCSLKLNELEEFFPVTHSWKAVISCLLGLQIVVKTAHVPYCTFGACDGCQNPTWLILPVFLTHSFLLAHPIYSHLYEYKAHQISTAGKSQW